MNLPLFARTEPIQTMADGTIKQLNPFSGTEVWTVPGRGNRPLSRSVSAPRPLDAQSQVATCAFCVNRRLETPPEKSRILPSGEILRGLKPGKLWDTEPLFRRVPNLFEILPFTYWQQNYGYELDATTKARMASYLEDPAGREHVFDVARFRLKASGLNPDVSDAELTAIATGFFGGGHDVIIAKRHFTDGATDTSQLASSGTLTPNEHYLFTRFTADSMRDLYQRNRYVSYVVAFQNWLAPAGASFDHLHKQLVAVDDRGISAEREVEMLRANPNMYNQWAVDYAAQHNLIIAENDHAVMYAGFGHRYPTIEIYSKSPTPEPWKQTPAEVEAMSDLIHAAHAAVGPQVACNEEWHHQSPSVDIPQPWRVMIKLRLSTLAGFEGGTKIYINTISPWDLRDRVVESLYARREGGEVAAGIAIATETRTKRNSLRYNPTLH
ncbi:UTP--glucose-1-phosphate uridylyltransferase [Corynebacterium phocae]|uniref:UTP--glucose-1-phosphate uridylyltransferase n=1 Tax=Corynebacterium phocae TaxID=161895 RepID=A0A1L7D2X5_9CORY|nr:DUF4921 family protein [Corynebacterium phocae]APT92332.1 UTP--glucose-1-phosphate uridylyltransferase [Corynebacterium phocae]KAA8724923.1 DUF4921 family protein [Corynebacterium phocae]